MKNAFLFALSAGVLSIAQPANSATLFESAPASPLDVLGGLPTVTNGQNFVAQFTLATAAQITGFEILSSLPSIGENVTIRFLNGSVLTSFADQIDAVTDYAGYSWATSNFAPITLGPGTYYMGMSAPVSALLDWIIFDPSATPGLAYPLLGDQFLDFDGDQIADQVALNFSFRVLGTPIEDAIPEPSTWLMMIAGFGLAGATLRRRSVHFQTV